MHISKKRNNFIIILMKKMTADASKVRLPEQDNSSRSIVKTWPTFESIQIANQSSFKLVAVL